MTIVYVFDVLACTKPAVGYPYRSEGQASEARTLNAERVFEWRHVVFLPNYVEKAIQAAGYKAKRIGWTTWKHSTWALYRQTA